MRKVLEDGLVVCSPCGDGLDGAIIDFEAERNEEENCYCGIEKFDDISKKNEISG